MAKQPKQTAQTSLVHIPKRTTIGNGKIRMSSMNKSKRMSFKKYRGQGK
jgi:hypothetical protein